MKLSLLHVKLFHDKKPNPILKTRTKRAKTKSKEVLTKPIPNSCGSMDTASNVEAETNDSASSMSFNEFETFADEVNGDIPEVDYRGRVKRCDLDEFV